jgi:diacylglycerol O-acyltransferase
MEPMVGIDAKFLYSETPTGHMHTIKVAIFDMSGLPAGVPYETLVEALGQQLGRLEAFRRRAVPVPMGLGHPVWVEDPDFDLSHHVSLRHAPAPGGDRELAAIVADIAGHPLRRDRPLWELVFVEGLANQRMAVVAKIHHALVDGSAAVALILHVMEGAKDIAAASIHDPWQAEPIPSGRELLALSFRDHRPKIRTLPNLAKRTFTGTRASQGVRRLLAIKPPLPLQAPRTSLNVSLTPERTFAMTSLPLEDFKAIRKTFGTTLNDVFLAVCSGALRRYLEAGGELPERTLIASVPVGTDPNSDRIAGNRVDNLFVSIGTNIADPVARLQHIHEVSKGAKAIRAVLGHDLMEERAAVTPPHLYRTTVRLWTRSKLANRVRPPVNAVLSNVPGPRELVKYGPIPLESLYSVGPILEGIGINITAWSYVDALQISVLGCPTSLPNPWAVIDALHESLDELRTAAEKSATDDATFVAHEA